MADVDLFPLVGGSFAAIILVTLLFAVLDACGVLPVAQQERADRRERIRLQAHVAGLQAIHQPGQTPQTFTYSPHHVLPPAPPLPALPEAAPALPEAALPGVTELGDVLAGGWHPNVYSILLGLGPGGKLITVPAGDALCHIAFAGPTGVGKTNLMRLFLTQLLAAGCEVALLDPHFTPYNHSTGEDWRPIAAKLAHGRGPLVDKDAILTALARLAGDELPRRLAAWNAGQPPFPPYFIAIEEAPALAEHDKRFMDYVRPLLREGRKLGLYVIMATQDALVSTLGTTSGVRSQFQTCYYGGGDPYSAKALLGMTPPNPPGKGVVWLRAQPVQEPALIRVPLVSNASIAALLGGSATIVDVTAQPAPLMPGGGAEAGEGAPLASPPQAPNPAPPPAPSAPPAPARRWPVEADPRAARVLELLQAGCGPNQILKELWGVSSGRAYTAASEELNTMLRDLTGRIG